ncbi:MAG: hypothetical protein LQ346_008181 [Caloplaca aetnensis]|nr:MAG: hypothetical protein LQ346_008181 [Caloplaca aetnensis]
MHSIHDLRILRDRMHTGLDEWGYGHIDLRYAHECHLAEVMGANQRMMEEMMGLQQPIKYWFGEMQPLTSGGGVMHHIVCVDGLTETLQRREERMRRAAVGRMWCTGIEGWDGVSGVTGAMCGGEPVHAGRGPSSPTTGIDAIVGAGKGGPEDWSRELCDRD